MSGRFAHARSVSCRAFAMPIPAPSSPARAASAPALAPAVRLGAQPGACRSHASPTRGPTWSSRATRASWTSCAPSCGFFLGDASRAFTCCPTGKCCPTTCSRRTRTSSRNACGAVRAAAPASPRSSLAAADTLGQRLPPRGYVRWPHLQSHGRRSAAASNRCARGWWKRATPRRQPGDRARRVRAARLAVRRVSDGRDDAAARRSVRRRDRGHPRIRSRVRSAPATR